MFFGSLKYDLNWSRAGIIDSLATLSVRLNHK
jgi:hypothetical protein